MTQETILNNTAILNEQPSDDREVENLSALAFGPGRFSRSAFRLREGVPHEPELSFVARDQDGTLVGSVRLTRIKVGMDDALLLGPLVVTPAYKNKGLGAKLMGASMQAAKEAGHSLIVLVGDLPYYERFGFNQVPFGKITMPAPVERGRLLMAELRDGAAEPYQGAATRCTS